MDERFKSDAADLSAKLKRLPTKWDGKKAILELKEADFQWRQMEWIGWYFEFHALRCAREATFTVPGTTYGHTSFDATKRINWDFKAHAIKSHTHTLITNDVSATDASIREHGAHGLAIALLDVTYNDDERTFQNWHTELKGGKSAYELEREARTAVSRYRKRDALLSEIVFVEITDPMVQCGIHRQGRNSNGKPRPTKYSVDLESLDSSSFIPLKF